jgi:hypothetical protein
MIFTNYHPMPKIQALKGCNISGMGNAHPECAKTPVCREIAYPVFPQFSIIPNPTSL